MNGFSRFRITLSANQLVLVSAGFILLFANQTFFRNLGATYAGSAWGHYHIFSLGLVLFCVLVLFLSFLSFRPIFKPALVFLFIFSAATAYFMDSYSVIIDYDMIINATATDVAEASDLLTSRLAVYLLLLGLLPSLLLSRIRLKQQDAWRGLRSRLKLVSAAIITMISLVLISNAFYASFVREHKELRYYTNPLTPIYGAYKLGKKQLRGNQENQVVIIGEDAQIPAADIDRELVIMVVGETARADRFSLNGYGRETNPKLVKQDVVSFNQVSACGTSTAISVPCMFAIYDQDEFSNDKALSTHNALDVLGKAGVNMLWRDNNSSSKGVSDRIITQDFRSPMLNPMCDEECRDEGMLAGLQDYVESQESGDILIVLHQMGSHGPAYYKRYPAEFAAFKPECKTSQLDDCSIEEIGNAYDNTILYTDHFLSAAIDFLRSNDDRFETALLYVSDHGESLGESGLYLHGLPNWIAPDEQTLVPVILWFGKNYDDVEIDAMRQLTDVPMTHDEIFHTVLGLFEISSGIYDEKKDILQRSRDLAGTPREYD